jgi:xanthine dehydrogenase small subunit
MTPVQFLLNGEPRAETSAAPTMTVLDWLRTVARLTGTKEGCAEGDCGACTIVVGRPDNGALRYQAVNSCLMMLPQLDGCAVLTIEGLAAPDGTLHPIQQAMVDADATQCGFCTPGFVMALFAFRQCGEPVDDAHVHEALAGNLCRCTGYRAIVDACRRAAGSELGRPADQSASAADALRAMPRCTEYRSGGQAFLAPQSLNDLLEATARHSDAIVLAGGTDLGLRVSKDREALPRVISTAGVRELKQCRVTPDALEIGGAATYSDALPHLDRHFSEFGALLRRIGSRQIRNLGTLAGNLATASPIGDTIPCLVALDAIVTLRSRTGARTLPVESFITGYRRTALAAGEIIETVRIPFLTADRHFAAYKLSKRFDQDIATVVAALRLTLEANRVVELCAAFGGMAPRVMRAMALERALVGRPWASDSLSDIDALLARDFTPISDHRGGAAYRLRAAAGLLRRFQLETSGTAAPTRVETL